MMSSDGLLEFPCDFPIKVMGKDSRSFRRTSLSIIEEHVGALANDDVSERQSKDGNFVALTYNLTIDNREQLDRIYSALSNHDDVLVVL